jgi:hypothetical protein
MHHNSYTLARGNMKLYELTNEWQNLQDRLVESDGELTPDMLWILDRLESELPLHVDNICSLVRGFLAGAEGAKAEAERLTKLSQAREKAASRLKSYLKEHMEKMGTRKVSTDLFAVRIQANPPCVKTDMPAEALPSRFVRVKTVFDIDKAKLIEAWKADEELPPGVSVEVGTHLRIS